MEEITPALSAEKWALHPKVYFREPRERGTGGRLDEGYGVEVTKDGDMAVWDDSWALTVAKQDRHALASLALYKQTFGFTMRDVLDEREAYVDATYLARRCQEAGDETERQRYIERARRHHERATRIAALLPPSP